MLALSRLDGRLSLGIFQLEEPITSLFFFYAEYEKVQFRGCYEQLLIFKHFSALSVISPTFGEW